MAAHRCGFLPPLFILCALSVLTVTWTQETIPLGSHRAAAADSKPTDTKSVAQTTEQLAVEQRQWEATEVEEATSAAAAVSKQDNSSPEDVVQTSTPKPKDEFQEELVVRPLHSGDIYASFQFRTLWQTDFTRERKGMLSVSCSIDGFQHCFKTV